MFKFMKKTSKGEAIPCSPTPPTSLQDRTYSFRGWLHKKEIPPKRKDFLKKAIHDCQQALDDAYMGFQISSDPDLIDRYIYELNAADMRYRVLLRELRETSPIGMESVAFQNVYKEHSENMAPIPSKNQPDKVF